MRWRTKTAGNLLEKTEASTLEDAVVRLVRCLRDTARDRGFKEGVLEPPYDPWPIAATLGAKQLRETPLRVDGHVVSEKDGLLVEVDTEYSSRQRRRFTLAHEAGHLALWKVNGKVSKGRARSHGSGSEIEALCNRIASEILAPRTDVVSRLAQRSGKDSDSFGSSPFQRGSAAGLQFVVDSIIRASAMFDVSLHFSAVRLKEVLGLREGVSLVDLSEGQFEWWVNVRPDPQLIRDLKEQAGDGGGCGSGRYWESGASGVNVRNYYFRKTSGSRALVGLSL